MLANMLPNMLPTVANLPRDEPKYIKMDPIEHILNRPAMYVGSVQPKQITELVFSQDSGTIQIVPRVISVSPALVRMFVEPLSNAVDNAARSLTTGIKQTSIYVTFTVDGTITIWNDGSYIPIAIHEQEKCYNHSLIFGQLLTGSNYNDKEDRYDISGTNGVGAKVVAAFSTFFEVEGVDPSRGLKLVQAWTNNMRQTSGPVVTPCKLKTGYTQVRYKLDFQRFGCDSYSPDVLALYQRLCLDAAMVTKLKVYWNDFLWPVKNLLDYAKLFPSENPDEILSFRHENCEVVVKSSTTGFLAVSFANGIYTPLGGVHVEPWEEALFRPLVEKFNRKDTPSININDVKQFFQLFVSATVSRPIFDAQTKQRLESPPVTAEVKKTCHTTILKWSVKERLENLLRSKEMSVLKKVERKRRGYEKVDGLQPANKEGGKTGHLCTLILVEGASASNYASWGLQVGVFGKKGPDYLGIYMLRGKLLNCRNATADTIAHNQIVSGIIKAVGLEHGLDYRMEENYSRLRYGRILIVTDADVDGLHISGLLQNMFHSLFPTLLQRSEPFLTAMQTPIVRVYQGSGDLLFYDERDYRNYVRELQGRKIEKQYYKGLATSKSKDVYQTFGRKLIQFIPDDQAETSMTLAFHNKYTNARKEWLAAYDPNRIALHWSRGNDPEMRRITLTDFVHTELIKFSLENCKRSIPSLMDGLKESQRKILYGLFKRKLNYDSKQVKISQLIGYISEQTDYHHGEESLAKAIVGMANCYPGSNNIPLLSRDGGFGTRNAGGKDAGASRYLHTKLDYLTRYIFRPEDDPLLEYIEQDGLSIEPTYYVPIIPMILVNGCSAGIGTGWSCYIPNYNPLDVIACVRVWLERNGQVFTPHPDNPNMSLCYLPSILPWYKDFTGEIRQENETSYTTFGRATPQEDGRVHVDELPIGFWTDDFREQLKDLWADHKIARYDEGPNKSPVRVDFYVTPIPNGIPCTIEGLKLTTTVNTSNMVLFDSQERIVQYQTVMHIIDAFCQARLPYYHKRKEYLLKKLEAELNQLNGRIRFIEAVRDNDIVMFVQEPNGAISRRVGRNKADLVQELTTKNYYKHEDSYDYLLQMPIQSFTQERIADLEQKRQVTQTSYTTLQSKTPQVLWLEDLAELEKHYPEWWKLMAEETILPVVNDEGEKVKTRKPRKTKTAS